MLLDLDLVVALNVVRKLRQVLFRVMDDGLGRVAGLNDLLALGILASVLDRAGIGSASTLDLHLR